MTALHERGLVLLAGPLEATNEILVIVRAADAGSVSTLLEDDPWTPEILPIDRIVEWTLRLGALPEPLR